MRKSPKNFTNKAIGLVAALAASLLFVSCAGSSTAGSSTADQQATNEIVYVFDYEVFHGAGFDDWVTYADHVAVVEVANEKRMEPEVGAEVTYIGRQVTVEVEQSMWWRDNRPARTLTFVANGWKAKDGQEFEIWPAEGPRLEVGQRYVVPLFEGSGGWGVLNTASIIPLDGDTPQPGFEPHGDAARFAVGRTTNQIQAELAKAKPDPLIHQVADDLDATQRMLTIDRLRSELDADPTSPAPSGRPDTKVESDESNS